MSKLPIEIAKEALTAIIRRGDAESATIAIEALTDIAIEEQSPPPNQRIATALVKRLFGGTHGGD